MDIEQLSKSQIVLLTLLVSFMTSIATGIVTVSLMDQAPPAIAQTVNRVIERTVETVAPSGNQAAATVVTQEKTVVVSEQNLIAQAVERIQPSIVRVYAANTDPAFLGIGIVIDAAGTIVVDGAALDERAEAMLTLPDGKTVRAFVTKRDKEAGIAFLTATSSERLPAWKPVTLATARPILGDTIVVIAGKSVARIESGIVTALIPGDNSPLVIDTNISSDTILQGSPIINTEGNVVGVSTGVARTSSRTGFIAASALIAPAVNKRP